jgi:hypothetical protein
MKVVGRAAEQPVPWMVFLRPLVDLAVILDSAGIFFLGLLGSRESPDWNGLKAMKFESSLLIASCIIFLGVLGSRESPDWKGLKSMKFESFLLIASSTSVSLLRLPRRTGSTVGCIFFRLKNASSSVELEEPEAVKLLRHFSPLASIVRTCEKNSTSETF